MPSGWTAETELLLRNLPASEGGSVFIAFPPASPDAVAVARRFAAEETVVYTPDSRIGSAVARDARALPGGQRIQVLVAPWYSPEGTAHSAAAVHLPREREMAEAALAMACRALLPSAPAWLVAGLRGGGRSVPALARGFLGRSSPVAAGRHCRLHRAQADPALSPPVGLDRWSRSFTVEVPGRTVTVVSLPGVFSHGRLDPGTGLLLRTLASLSPVPTRTLDFGCGSGVVGTCLRFLWPGSEIDLVDVNAVAVESSRRTLAANGLDPSAARLSDGFSEAAGKYDLIVSNPPFHSGAATDRSVAATLIRAAAEHLLPGGALRIVANRFLPYPAIMKSVFGGFSSLAENGRYRVLESSRPKRRRQ